MPISIWIINFYILYSPLFMTLCSITSVVAFYVTGACVCVCVCSCKWMCCICIDVCMCEYVCGVHVCA